MNALKSNNYLRSQPNALGFSTETSLTVIDTPLAMFGREHISKCKFTPISCNSKVISRSILIDRTQYIVNGDHLRTPQLSKAEAKANGITQIHVGYRQFKQMERNSFMPKPSCTVIPLPDRTPQTVRLLPSPPPSRIGQVIAIAGLSQTCTIERVFDKWDETWVQVRHPYGIATRKLSEIGD